MQSVPLKDAREAAYGHAVLLKTNPLPAPFPLAV